MRVSGEVLATPIIRWLEGVAGPIEQFNQTMVVQAPAGVTEADVAVVLQALLDRHAMLRLRVDNDGAGGWSLWVPGAGSVDARALLHAVDVLSDEALVGGAVAVEPGHRDDAECIVGGAAAPIGVDHSPSGRRWGVVANPVGRHQYCLGPAPQRARGDVARAGDIFCPLGVAAR